MGHFRRLMLVLGLAGAGFCGGEGAAFAAAGAAPSGRSMRWSPAPT